MCFARQPRGLSLRDNGIGIEAQYLNEIFTPLKRLHPASEFPGTGKERRSSSTANIGSRR
jgi:light-regulated signal transduction histidine kinase (bacteriophytochrome)